MARIGSETPEQFLVGWRTKSNGAFHLGVIDASGAFLEGPEQLSSTGPGWGNRDDSFQGTPDGGVAWVEGISGAATLTLHHYSDAGLFADGFESGDNDLWSSTAP
ncbi:MAG: hypothetical protein IFJ96_05695 [Acidobacteria bacterium]|nr:hypothetical protein [Candidatus Sulfomarinibacter sp. MAG AM2]